MNNSYFSSSSNDYSYEYSSPSISTCYSSPSVTSCPIHSLSTNDKKLCRARCADHFVYPFYLSPRQSNYTSRASYSYYPEQQLQIFSPSIQQQTGIPTSAADRTPLRRYQCFKKNELQILHQIYIQDAYPSIVVLQQLAIQLNVSVDKVRQWFKNRRHNDKQKKQTTARVSTST